MVFKKIADKKCFKTLSCNPYKAKTNHVYWKIGLTLQDVDVARDEIMKFGTNVSKPIQYKDTGYLCHLKDPDGFSIELLQHTFEENFVKPSLYTDLILCQPCLVGE